MRAAAIGGGMAVCLPGYTAVGDKCYSVSAAAADA